MPGWLKRLFSRREGAPKMDEETLSALARGIQHAASSTFEVLANQYVGLLGQFFIEGPDKKLIAKMVYVRIDDAHWTTVPLISLVAPRGLSLDKMKVSMSVRIEETQLKKATVEGLKKATGEGDKGEIERMSMRITLSPRTRDGARRSSDVTDIDMEFSAGDPPEAIMRIIDTFANQIDPKPSLNKQPDLARYPATSLVYKAKADESASKSGESGSAPS